MRVELSRGRTAIGCAALLAIYAALAGWAANRESPTFDEPYHALSAWVQLHHHDYRIDNEDPPLWQYWASLPNGRDALRADFDGRLWREMGHDVGNQWIWTTATLYGTPGNDAARFIGRCRLMMLVVAVALGAAIAAWAWRLAGPGAALAATALYALDPNFIAHGGLMKNDVAASLAWLGVAWGLWDVGRRATVGSIARLALLAALPIGIKYSGVLVGALVPGVLLVRAIMREPWTVLGRPVHRRAGRAATAAAISVVVGLAVVGGIWAEYGFRYRSGPGVGDHLDVQQLVDRAVDHERKVGRAGPGLAVRAVTFAGEHRLLPEGFVAGFLFTYAESLIRPSYLLGQVSYTGWWYYFPAVMAMKTPTATSVAMLGVAVLALRARRTASGAGRWAAAGLAVPVIVYLTSALSTNLNIGLRHVLPVYPLMFVAAGWAATRVQRRTVAGAVIAVLGVEMCVAYSHLIPFTNAPTLLAAGGNRLGLFGDSNLDWGQDLPLLQAWQRGHMGEPLYLGYFGSAEPSAYGIAYTPLPGGPGRDGRRRFPTMGESAWVAVSATMLQATPYTDPQYQPYYRNLARRTPAAVLGGTIYLYRAEPTDLIVGR